jgi:hypothetical protein
MAKGGKVLFVFILCISNNNRAQPMSYWKVLKKCHYHHSTKLKKPKVFLGDAPVVLAILKKLELVKEEAMTEVKPLVPINLPPLPPLLPCHNLSC